MKTLILILDHGTTGIKVCLMNRQGEIVARAYEKIPQLYPQPGWVEHDPMVLWQLTLEAIAQCFQQSRQSWREVHAIGITNQRETTILWDKITGQPVHNAIVWQCRRTAEQCDAMKADTTLVKQVQERSGLVIDAYFSASKIQWLLQNCPQAKTLLEQDRLLFGTVDTWILWNLSGRSVHATDFTNASRTMLFNLQTKSWDATLLDLFSIPPQILPDVKSASGFFADCDPALTEGVTVPVFAMIGDQQSALYGQKCWQPGSCKNTFGTGAFLMMNIGDRLHLSNQGLLTTLACDALGNPVYALEGAIFIAGAALEWLKDPMRLVDSFETADRIAASLSSNEGVYMVPAFVGLGAPYWRSDVRGTMTGLTQGCGPAHFARAVFESMAYQTADVLKLMHETAQLPIQHLKVDGGVCRSAFLMQFLADMTALPIYRLTDTELTAKGAGYLAGLGSGFWADAQDIAGLPEQSETFFPNLSVTERHYLIEGWQAAVQKALL